MTLGPHYRTPPASAKFHGQESPHHLIARIASQPSPRFDPPLGHRFSPSSSQTPSPKHAHSPSRNSQSSSQPVFFSSTPSSQHPHPLPSSPSLNTPAARVRAPPRANKLSPEASETASGGHKKSSPERVELASIADLPPPKFSKHTVTLPSSAQMAPLSPTLPASKATLPDEGSPKLESVATGLASPSHSTFDIGHLSLNIPGNEATRAATSISTTEPQRPATQGTSSDLTSRSASLLLAEATSFSPPAPSALHFSTDRSRRGSSQLSSPAGDSGSRPPLTPSTPVGPSSTALLFGSDSSQDPFTLAATPSSAKVSSASSSTTPSPNSTGDLTAPFRLQPVAPSRPPQGGRKPDGSTPRSSIPSLSSCSVTPSSSTSSTSAMSAKLKTRLRATPIACEDFNRTLFCEAAHPPPLLVVDVRPYSDFVVGHIASAFNVTLSSIMLRRLHQRKIRLIDLIKEEQKDEFQGKLDTEGTTVVVYDADTKFADDVSLAPKNPLHVIVNWLQENGYNTVYLQGGFQAMKDDYEVVENHLHAAVQPAGLSLKLPNGTPSPSVTTPIERHKCEKEPTAILSDLYVGAEDHANDAEVIKRLGITHILNVTTRAPQNRHPGVKYMLIEILDSWNQDLIAHFEPAFDFIDEARKAGGCILIHCMAGISRSPTVAIGYLMKTDQLSLSNAYHLVKSKRTSIAPNLDFMGELEIYERKLQAENPEYQASGWVEEKRSSSLAREGERKQKLPSAKGLTISIPPRSTK